MLAGRRRVLRAGFGRVAPVALTLASGPVGAGMCIAGSAYGSMMVAAGSRTPQAATVCTGLSPGAWSAAADWSAANVNRNSAHFNAFFAGGGSAYQLPSNPKLSQVLADDPGSMASHVIAVWLNARAGSTGGVFLGSVPPTSAAAEVVHVWENIVAHGGPVAGGYLPPGAPGAAWTSAETKTWLALTW